MKAFLKKYAFGLISGLLSLGMILFFSISNHGLENLFSILLGARGSWLLAAVGCMMAYWLLEAVILHIFTLNLVPKYRFSYSLINMMVGQLYNALTPFATGGQVMQVFTMGRTGLTPGASTAVLAMRTLVYHVIIAGYAIASVIIGAAYVSAIMSALWVLLALGLAVNLGVSAAMWLIQKRPGAVRALAAWGVRTLHRFKLLKRPEERLASLQKQIDLFHDSSAVFGKNRWTLLSAYLISFIQMTFFFAIPYCIYRSFGYSGTSASLIISVQSIVSMVSAFVPLPGSSGGAEGSFFLMFGRIFSEGDLMPAMLIWRFITYYMCILVGCVAAVAGDRFITRSIARGRLTGAAPSLPDAAETSGRSAGLADAPEKGEPPANPPPEVVGDRR